MFAYNSCKPEMKLIKAQRPSPVLSVLRIERRTVGGRCGRALPCPLPVRCHRTAEHAEWGSGRAGPGAWGGSSRPGSRPFALSWGPAPSAVASSRCLPVQSPQQSPSSTRSSLSTSTVCGTPQTSWKPSRRSEPSATTTRASGCPATPTATPSSSGSSTSAFATGSCCPSVWCWPARSWCVQSSS